jgi:uncharacterized membrane protein
MIRELRPSISDRRFVVLAVLVCLSAAAVGLVAFRVLYTHSLLHASFLWNLALAWIPFVLALVVYDRAARNRGRSVVAVAGLWLLFFPNAPYIVTDFVHLRGSEGRAYWFDLVLIATVATTGLLLGFVSLYLVHVVVRRAAGAAIGWAFVAVALALSSLGVYLGRVWRWNSWDALVSPWSVVERLAHAFASPDPHAVAFMLAFTLFLAATYAAFYFLAGAGAGAGERARRRS